MAEKKRWSLRAINKEIETILANGIDVPDEYDESGRLITIITEDDKFLGDALDALELARDVKIENIGVYQLQLKAKSQELDDEIKRLTAWKKRIDNRWSWLNWYCLEEMIRSGVQKVAGKFVTVSVRKSPVSATYAKNIDDTPNVDEIDSRYIRTFTEFKVDKKSALDAYRQALKVHVETGGNADNFQFEVKGFLFHNRNNHLSVK